MRVQTYQPSPNSALVPARNTSETQSRCHVFERVDGTSPGPHSPIFG